MTSYDESFFKNQMSRSHLSAQKMLPYILQLTSPHSIADVGCGVGGWLAQTQTHGIEDVIGFDGDYVCRDMLKIPKEKFISADLSKPLHWNRRFDLVISLEVAEHIEPERADIFVQTLVALADVVFFSAAIPGQGGVNHVNEQWPEYWIEKFSDSDYRFLDCIRKKFWSDSEITPCYRQNSFLFVKKGKEGIINSFDEVDFDRFDLPPRTVHPDIFNNILADSIHHTYFTKAIRILPKLFAKAVKSRVGSISSS